MRRLLSMFATLSLASLACQTLAPRSPTPSPLPVIFTPEATPTPVRATAVPPTEAASPTAAATPRRTATPEPTSPPEGYYSHPTAGFSFIHSDDWILNDESGDGVSFFDQRGNVLFFAFSQIETPPLTFDEELETLMTSLSEAFSDLAVESRGAAQLAEVEAETATVSAASDGEAVTLYLVLTRREARAYAFIFVGLMENVADRRDAIDELLGTVLLFEQVFGLDRSDVLSMLGGDPDPEDLDPATTYGSAQGYVGHLYSGLVRLSPQLQIEPDLAGEWDISPDGRVYTFTLRSGLTFQSGDPLTAEAVRASWERAADPDIESPTAATYLGDILGVKDKLAGEAESIAGLSVVDDRTLVVTLDAPKPYFLAKLTYPTAYVVNPRAVDEGGARWMFEPDASGPYALREYNAGSSILFERNPAYYQPPAIQYIAYTFYPGGSGISLYEAGQIDILFIGALDAAHVREPDDPLHAEWQSVPSLCTSFLMFDNHKPPLDDVNVRKALMLALDRDTLIERFTENLDLRADTILPPAMPGHSDEFPLYKFDVAAARQALAESKYADNLPALVLNERGSGDEASDFLTAVAEMWRENLGLEVSIEFLDPRDYTRAAREQHGHAVTYGWCADYPDPENFLDVLFHSASDFNVAAYSNPDVDALLEEARTELDPARRLDLYHQAETLILEDAGALPWQHSIFDVLVKPRINGYVISPMHTAFVHLLSFEAP